MSSFEFAAHVSKLYNQCVLNMNQLITWKNIDKLEVQVKKNLEYLASLWRAELAYKARCLEDWEKTLFAKDTYDILRISFCGFFGYC